MTNERLSAITDFLKSQAREAGKIMRRYYRGKFKVYTKNDKTRVTDVDLAISEMVQERSGDTFPDVDLYTEELTDREFLPDRDYFIIDELDGTSFFIEEKKGFSHQAAFYSAEQGLMVGLVYLPMDDLMLYAVRGKGAFLEEKGKITEIPPPPIKDITQLRYAHPARYKGDKYRKFLQKLGARPDQIVLTSSYKTLQFARGELDVSIHLKGGMPPWDWAGEKVIVEELGYRYTYLDGREIRFGHEPVPREKGFLICPAILHPTLVQRIQQVLASDARV